MGGVNDTSHLQEAIVKEGFDFAAIGRALLREPDLINKMENNSEYQGLCNHCNKCMFSVYSTTNCVFTKDYAISSQEPIN